MKEIKLSRGMVALVDDDCYDELNKHKWSILNIAHIYYAVRNSLKNEGRKRVILMHREILKLTDRKIYCDHINHNGLDNQRHNLRCCTQSQNRMNTISKTGSSQYKGVYWSAECSKWRAQLRINGKKLHLGAFINELDAAKSYDNKARELFGEFASLNFK